MGLSKGKIHVDAMVKVFSINEMLDFVHIARNVFLYICFGIILSIQFCGESNLTTFFYDSGGNFGDFEFFYLKIVQKDMMSEITTNKIAF